MKNKLKWIFFPLTALVYVVVFLFKFRENYREEVELARKEADKAKADAIHAQSDMKKAEIKHDTEDALADAAALSDDDILADALADYRAGRSDRGPGGLDPKGANPNR